MVDVVSTLSWSLGWIFFLLLSFYLCILFRSFVDVCHHKSELEYGVYHICVEQFFQAESTVVSKCLSTTVIVVSSLTATNGELVYHQNAQCFSETHVWL
jgi:hypothetical protein